MQCIIMEKHSNQINKYIMLNVWNYKIKGKMLFYFTYYVT